MNQDIAHRLSSAWASDPTVRSGSIVWTLHLCGEIDTGGHRFLGIAACGPTVRWLAVAIPDDYRLMTLDVTNAVALNLDANDAGVSAGNWRWVA